MNHHLFAKALLGAVFCAALAVTAWAEAYDIFAGSVEIRAEEAGQFVTYQGKTISDEHPVVFGMSQSVGAIRANTLRVTVAEGARGSLTLRNLTIDTAVEDDQAPMKLTGKGSLLLLLDGQNQLSGGKQNAGLESGMTPLWISAASESGSLTAKGGALAAGIGGGRAMDGGNITILSGKIQACGGAFGAGIGGGQGGSGRAITISGGQVTASAGAGDIAYGAGIGGGQNGSCENIMITDGAVSAVGSDFGAAIGGGQAGNASQICVAGGNLTVRAGDYAPGIGGGWGGRAQEIRILGGRTEAAGNPALPSNSDAVLITGKSGLIKLVSDGTELETVRKGETLRYCYDQTMIVLESSLPVPEKLPEPQQMPDEPENTAEKEAPAEDTEEEASPEETTLEPEANQQEEPVQTESAEEMTSEPTASDPEEPTEAPQDLTVTDLAGEPVAYEKRVRGEILYIQTAVKDGIYTVSMEDLRILDRLGVLNIALVFDGEKSEVNIQTLLSEMEGADNAVLRREQGNLTLVTDNQLKQLP